MKETGKITAEKKSRRSLLAALGILSVWGFFKMGFFSKKRNQVACAPPAEKETMKFLTQDGVLVEVDIANILPGKEKATARDLQEWIKK